MKQQTNRTVRSKKFGWEIFELFILIVITAVVRHYG
jgi:hypothetical protein